MDMPISWRFKGNHMVLISACLRCSTLGVGTTRQFSVPTFIGSRLHINIIFKMGDFAAELLTKVSQLGFIGDETLTSDTLRASLELNERFKPLFRYLLDTIS